MSNIEVVIKIPKKDYLTYSKLSEKEINELSYYERIIANGTQLPKECDIQRIIPKRVNIEKWIYTKCPNQNCNHELSTHHGDGYYTIEHKPNFCPDCGQALLWEESEE